MARPAHFAMLALMAAQAAGCGRQQVDEQQVLDDLARRSVAEAKQRAEAAAASPSTAAARGEHAQDASSAVNTSPKDAVNRPDAAGG